MRAFCCLLWLILCASALHAQERRPSHCIALAQETPGLSYLHRASWQDPVAKDSVLIRYIAHASFLLRTEGGLNVVTDFTGFTGSAPLIPDVVTMNHAHETHWTAHPDPAIPHVLEGWGPFGAGIDHHLDLGEMLIRKVPTDIRNMFGGVEPRGNSIFVFEAAGLCIGHLGHLHHEPTPDQYAAIGRLDVVMAPVAGGMTLPRPDMIRVRKRLRASVVIPMHWVSDFGLGNFLSAMDGAFAVVETEESELVLSLATLPKRPTIITLRPRFLRDPG
jgi:L-ascorbate metabolism protein UlaG (beta-lactamase superfamily)